MPRIRKQITTAKDRLKSSGHYYDRHAYKFVDVYNQIHGTVPEKMVYSALTKAGIRFYYLNDITFSDPVIDFIKEYQADFILPDAKIIIEVQGAFWHSKPANIQADSYKMAVYTSFGYTALAWWDFEIFNNLAGLMGDAGLSSVAYKFAPWGQTTELVPMKRTKIDTSKGIRTMNARKYKAYRVFVGTSRRKLKKVQSSYATTKRK